MNNVSVIESVDETGWHTRPGWDSRGLPLHRWDRDARRAPGHKRGRGSEITTVGPATRMEPHPSGNTLPTT